MSSFKEKCVEYFGSSDFYEILKIDKSASEKEIKKAYHKLSLLVHPDRVEESKKTLCTEKFKVLGKIHSVLSDADKRKIYDDCGEFDEENDSSYNWMDYWRAFFKKIEKADIENYKKEYIGSETELRDIKKSYLASKGSMDYMFELVPFIDCENEERIIKIVRKMVDNKEVPEYKRFFNESQAKKARRKKKWDDEKTEAEKIDIEELQKQIDNNIARHAKNFETLINSLETKYSTGSKRKSISNSGGSSKAKSRRKK